MNHHEMIELSKAVNSEARRQYPSLAERTGTGSLATKYLPRISLRTDTPYPYAFRESDEFYPEEASAFGRVISASHEEGLRAIHAEIGKHDQEHAWMYVPEAEIWIDNTLGVSEASVENDQYLQTYLSYMFSSMNAVHTHPDKVVEALHINYSYMYSPNFLAESAQPSASDSTAHTQLVARNSRSNVKTESIVSHYGVTAFKLKSVVDDGLYWRSEEYNRFIPGDVTPALGIRLALARWSASIVLLKDESPAFDISFQELKT